RRPAVRGARGRMGRERTPRAVPARRLLAVPARLDAVGRLRRPLRPGGELMTASMGRFAGPRILLLAAMAFATALAVARSAGAYHTQFIATYCNYGNPIAMDHYMRDMAITWAEIGTHEGYQWGGGCWNNDNFDNSPGDPPSDPNTGGEGGDCSGFTFKVWHEAQDTSNSAFWGWNKFRFIHGPYSADGFRTGAGAPNVTYSKTGLIKMDALASSTHIGMIYQPNGDGTDQIIEAKGEAYGMNIWTRTYRGNASYGGVRRLGWAG